MPVSDEFACCDVLCGTVVGSAVAWTGRTHQRGEKGMCHGKFLYLVSEREGAVGAGGQEGVVHAQLAQVGYDEAG